MEESLYQCELGKDYPRPIVDVKLAAKEARDRLWGFRKNEQVQQEKYRILATHVRPPNAREKARRAAKRKESETR